MKKLWITLAFLIAASPAFGSDQWAKGSPAGTDLVSDIDTLVQTNNEAIDRLKIGYRKDCSVLASSVATINVLAGELAIPNADGSVVRYRRNTTTTAVTWANIDAGAEAVSTQYYVYALADTDATTFTVKISTSASAPTGATYYRKIGYFYNNSSGNIVSVGNVSGDSKNILYAVGSSDITSSSSSFVETTDMSVKFIGTGRPVRITFSLSGGTGAAGADLAIAIAKDGTAISTTYASEQGYTGISTSLHTEYIDTPTSGSVVTYSGMWRGSSTIICNVATVYHHRIITVEEL